MFESIAQIYYPYDISDKEKFKEEVSVLSRYLRRLVFRAYRKASEDKNFKEKLELGDTITIDDKVYNLEDYGNKISEDAFWGSEDDLKILSKLLGFSYSIVIHGVGKEFIRYFPEGKPLEDYFTFCHLDGNHWRLKKHERKPDLEPFFQNALKETEPATLYFENRGDGNSLFESIAQIYYPYDISDKDFKKVPRVSSLLRRLVFRAYRKASKDEKFKQQLKLGNIITVGDKVYNLEEYSIRISKDASLGSENDLRILSTLLGFSYSKVTDCREKEVFRYFPKGKSSENYFTFCHLDSNHWKLKKHTTKLDLKPFFENAFKETSLSLSGDLNNIVVEAIPELEEPVSTESPEQKAYVNYTPTYHPGIQKGLFGNIFSKISNKMQKNGIIVKEKLIPLQNTERVTQSYQVNNLTNQVNQLQKELQGFTSSIGSAEFSKTAGDIGKYLLMLFRHFPLSLILFGFIADIINNDFRYSIPSLIGISSAIVNSFVGIVMGLFIPFQNEFVSGSPLECSVPGFGWLDSIFSPQGIVVPSSIFTYLFIDFGVNRSASQNLGTLILFVLFFLIHLIVMIGNDCFKHYYGGMFSLVIALSVGFLFGLFGWIGVRVSAPDRLPTNISSGKPVASVVSSSSKLGTTKCSNPNDKNEITCNE